MKRAGQKENIVLSQCLKYLELIGVYCWRNNTGAYKMKGYYVRFGKVGSGDILGILPDGRFLSVECKRESGGVVSPEQKEFMHNIKKNGGLALIVNSLDSLISQLKLYGY